MNSDELLQISREAERDYYRSKTRKLKSLSDLFREPLKNYPTCHCEPFEARRAKEDEAISLPFRALCTGPSKNIP